MPRTRTAAAITTTTTADVPPSPPLGYKMTRRLRVVMYNAMDFEREAFEAVLDEIPMTSANSGEAAAVIPEMDYVDARLSPGTVCLSKGSDVVSLYVTDQGDSPILQKLAELGVTYISERYSGSANVDRDVAASLGFKLSNVPIQHCAQSIAEYTLTLILTLTKRLIPAVQRYASNHCILPDIFGNDLSTRTVGVVGTGEVGTEVIRWLRAFDCTVLAFDSSAEPNPYIVDTLGAEYVSFDTLLARSHIITLHAPLVPATVHMIDRRALARCRRGVTIVNTARGALVHNPSIIQALHSGQVGAFGADSLEGESDLLFDESTRNASKHIDELTTMNNVLITIHQGQTTLTAASKVARETFKTLLEFQRLMNAKEDSHNNHNHSAGAGPAAGRAEKNAELQ